jgi:hypothetical protein
MLPEVFDSSMLAAYKSCPSLFRLVYSDEWKSKKNSVHLHAGGSFAKGVETTRKAFYEDSLTSEDAIALGAKAVMDSYGDFDAPSEGSGSAKTLDRMVGAFIFYFDNYPLTLDTGYPIILPGGRRGIEYSFVHPLPIDHPETGNPLLYAGRMDAILHYSGAPYIFDEKTTSRLGPTWGHQWDLRSQFIGYTWGCQQAGIMVKGAVVRGVSILKEKYETQESINNFSEWEVDRWYGELLDWIQEIVKCYQTKKWRHSFDHACTEYGGCAFRSVCKSPDEKPWLETYFERRHWDPVTREETLL